MPRRVRAKTVSLLVLAALLSGLSSRAVIGAAVTQADSVRYVSPSASDANDGSFDRPLKTIQKALDLAEPGSMIQLAAGRYAQDFATVRGGVTVSGPKDAIVVGAGGSRIAQIKHDDVRLTGFTIDGKHSSIDSASSYRDKLIYAMSTTARDGVDRIRIDNMTLTNAGGECVRLRYFVTAAVVEDNTISNCGVHDFRFNGGGKNGEAIYIGTAPEQRGTNGAPTADPDVSRDNVVRNNTIDSQGNECVDVKEDSTANLAEGNSCTGQKDPDSAGLDSRGSGNTFRGNTVFGNVGAGVRLGGDTETDGIDNEVAYNVLRNNQRGGIKVMRNPQGTVCGNDFSDQDQPFVGTYAASFDPGAECGALAFGAVADARVNANNPSANYGGDTTVRAKGGSAPHNSYFKFTVTGVSGSVTSAKLRLQVTDASVHGGSVRSVVDTTWTEEGITYNNAPAFSSTVLSSAGAVTNGQMVEFDLGNAITGDGTYSLALTSTNSSDAVAYSRRQGTSPPQLLVTTGPPAAPQAQFTTSSRDATVGQPVSFTDTSTGSPTSWSWSFGDGTTSTSQHPSHAYTGAGTYTVSLTATNATGTDTETKVDHITVVSTQHRFNPVADASVNARKPSANYGTESTLKAKGGSFTNTSYLKFTVRGVSGPVASVKLRLRVTDGSVHGGSIRPVVDTTWTESGITFRNAPAISSTVLSSTGAVTNGQTVEFDLGSAITGDGTYSLALTSTSSDSVAYSSRQGTSPPELVITTGP